jgi:ribosomal protein S18 acetylase RimI-like enzyme
MNSPGHALTILAVGRLDQAAGFYQAAFGWPVAVEVPVYVELALPHGQRLGLYRRDAFTANTGTAPADLPGDALAPCELYLSCADLPAAVARARAAGARLLSPAAARSWGDEVAYLADPDGNVLALARPLPDDDIELIERDRAALCRGILEALPAWFGIPSAIDDYARAADQLPTYAPRAGLEYVGIMTLREHQGATLELSVMAILPGHHRRGFGRKLIRAAEAHARARDLHYLTVKTLGPSRPNDAYAATRAFYLSQGFVPLEELPELWDPANPCLILIKPVR